MNAYLALAPGNNCDGHPHYCAQNHCEYRTLLVGTTGIHMHTKIDERENRRCCDGGCQPHGPALQHPQPGTGYDIGETRQKVEPDHERYIVPGGDKSRAVTEKDSTA